MARKLSDIANKNVEALLDELVDQKTNSDSYALAMYGLGKVFGANLFSCIKGKYNTISLVATVEDTDSLGKGIIDVLELSGIEVRLIVFWNKRFKTNEDNGVTIAPIIKEFHQPFTSKLECLVVIKSIISNSCVVRTNLTRIIESELPEQIFVVAPVMFEGAIPKLAKEFDDSISSKFKYLYFAEDNERKDGIVLPGIGGDVYQRLGFKGQDDKNKFTPKLVKERRYHHA